LRAMVLVLVIDKDYSDSQQMRPRMNEPVAV